jgi:hypothetical protein
MAGMFASDEDATVYAFTSPNDSIIVFTSRPAFDALKLGTFELSPGFDLRRVPYGSGDAAAAILTAPQLHAIKQAVVLNAAEPTQATVWQAAQHLMAHFDTRSLSTLTVPAGVDGAKRGKVPAKHVKFAATWPDEVRWSRAHAVNHEAWFGHAECAGLGLFVSSDMLVLDFDAQDDEAFLGFFESMLPHFGSAPMEFTGGGVHVFFTATVYSRQWFPSKVQFSRMDLITVTKTGTPHFIAISPSRNKRPVPGRVLGTDPLQPIPDALVDALVAVSGVATVLQKQKRPHEPTQPRGGPSWFTTSDVGVELFTNK